MPGERANQGWVQWERMKGGPALGVGWSLRTEASFIARLSSRECQIDGNQTGVRRYTVHKSFLIKEVYNVRYHTTIG